MVIVLDIGNSDIKTGLFCEGKMLRSFRLRTERLQTPDEYATDFSDMFLRLRISLKEIKGVMISSVVPEVTPVIISMWRMFGIDPMILTDQLNCGLKLLYHPQNALGGDRIANAVAAVSMVGSPVLTVDFGTATTFGAVDKHYAFCGGAIAPGLRTAMAALVQKASNLGEIELIDPNTAIANNTKDCVRAGMLYGFSGLADGILARMKTEIPDAKVIATGGLANIIAPHCRYIDLIEPMLTLRGIYEIYLKNT